MARFAVIGDPISHSLSPAMHTAAYQTLGLDHTYEAIRVPLTTLSTELDRLRSEGYQGINITVPLKEAAMHWADPDEFARKARAVNTIDLTTKRGVNTDGPSMVDVLRRLEPRGDKVLLLGAGGSGRAVALALTTAGFEVDIWNRTAERAVQLAEDGGGRAIESVCGDYDVVINATSSSMAPGSQLPLESVRSRNSGIAIDLFYTVEPTPFMRHFALHGWETHDGRELLVAQGAAAFTFWLGIPAPLEAMRLAVGL